MFTNNSFKNSLNDSKIFEELLDFYARNNKEISEPAYSIAITCYIAIFAFAGKISLIWYLYLLTFWSGTF